MKLKVKILVSLLFVTLLAGFLAAPVMAQDYKKFGVRVRALAVYPDAENNLTDNLDVSDDLVPELDLEYFFTPRLSAELILGVTRHNITAAGSKVGSTWLLPPTLTLKYHFFDSCCVNPYLGVGMNYVMPFDEQLSLDDNFSIDSSFGWAAQAGVDIDLDNNWYANIDVKYLNLETEMKVNGVKYDLDLNPLLVGLGIGYRF